MPPPAHDEQMVAAAGGMASEVEEGEEEEDFEDALTDEQLREQYESIVGRQIQVTHLNPVPRTCNLPLPLWVAHARYSIFC